MGGMKGMGWIDTIRGMGWMGSLIWRGSVMWMGSRFRQIQLMYI